MPERPFANLKQRKINNGYKVPVYRMMRLIPIIFICFLGSTTNAQKLVTTNILIVGGGTGGTAAGIQSARMNVNTVIVEATPWLGGMISAAGVSAIDGNHRLPSGLWAEFRNQLYKVYGGPKGVETGWVSNTLFEPHVADSIFKAMAANEKALSVYHNYIFQSLVKKRNKIYSVRFVNKNTGGILIVKAKIVIDASELGDVLKAAGVPYDLGMEAGVVTGETVGVHESNYVVQDLTYVATLKDYGIGTDHTIPKPANYNPSEFDAACSDYYNDITRKAPAVDAKKLLDYGKLPHNKYMLNWPSYGNDTYLNVVEMNDSQREKELEKAKATTLRFVYFIQHQLGYKNLGLADDEFPTSDKLALVPYYREGRRVKGLVRMNMRHIAEPFTYGDPLYRTGISVGDYPIDHHHKKNPAVPQHLDFYPIPSFNIPLGALIPQKIDNLIIAEKGISVSNVVNGTTRLQPVVLLTGQAAGTLAALSYTKRKFPKQVSIRSVQNALLNAQAYIMPYIDVTPDNPHFQAIQKIGATGILKGRGIPLKWANQTWFYPDSLVNANELIKDLKEFQEGNYFFKNATLSLEEGIHLAKQLNQSWYKSKTRGKLSNSNQIIETRWNGWGLKDFDLNRRITRLELAVLLDETVKPFERKLTYRGYYKIQNKN